MFPETITHKISETNSSEITHHGKSSGFEIPKNQTLILEEVNKLLKKGVVVECEHEPVEYISPIFLREKTDGTQRLILNLKKLDKYLECKHFKMQTILTLIQPNCYMATINLKDTYYSVKIEGDDTCFLKFLCNSKLLKFVVLRNALSPDPRKITKLTKPPLAMLRMQGYTVAIYIDDIIAIDQSFEEYLLTVVETIINLFQKPGFAIHPDENKFIPAKIVEYLGSIIDSEKMITYLSDQKKFMRNVASPLVCRLLKGVFNIRPALSRCVPTWDVTKVFTFIK